MNAQDNIGWYPEVNENPVTQLDPPAQNPEHVPFPPFSLQTPTSPLGVSLAASNRIAMASNLIAMASLFC